MCFGNFEATSLVCTACDAYQNASDQFMLSRNAADGGNGEGGRRLLEAEVDAEDESESELPPPPLPLWEDEEGEGFVGWQPLYLASADRASDGDGSRGGGGGGGGGGSSVARSLGATRADPDPTDWLLLAGVCSERLGVPTTRCLHR